MELQCGTCQSRFRLDSKLIQTGGSLVRCSNCQIVFRVYPSDLMDRRKFPRTKTRNLIAHISFDQNGKMISQGLGKALDLSKGGLLLETPYPIEAGLLSLMAVDKDNMLFEIKAELVYCKKLDPGKYQSGIKFKGSELQVRNFVKRLITEYNFRKNTMSFALPC